MRQSTRFWSALCGVLLVAGFYSSYYALRGWIPHDEGLLGQMAERVLDGELPHSDFDETYSGGLTLLHAASFAVFGHRLSSFRLTLFLFQLGFLASVFCIATRAGSLTAAALITLLCLAWGPPNYFGSLPSWYNLGFAIFAIHSAVKYIETDRPYWIFLAGVMGGLSCLFKVAGAYLVLGLAVFVIYRSRLLGSGTTARRGQALSSLLIIVALLFPIVFLLGITWARLGPMEIVYFIVPATAVCAVVAWNELQPAENPRPAIGATIRALLYLGGGVVTPVALFMLPYALRGELYWVYRGLIVLPQLRFDFAFYPVPPAITLLAALPVAAAVCLPLLTRLRGAPVLAIVLASALAVLLAFGSTTEIYRLIWYSVRPLGPLAALVLCALVLRFRNDREFPTERRQLLFLMAAMAAFHSVIQFPYAFGVYFYYAAPPIVSALLLAAAHGDKSWSAIQVCIVLFYIGFGVLWLNTGNVRTSGVQYERSKASEQLMPDRANLYVSEVDKSVYDALIGVVKELAGNDTYILATPDCPEVYFLSGKKNPTRIFYEFFDPEPPTAEQLLATLKAKDIRVVVLNGSPEFSKQVSPELYRLLEQDYPEHVDIGWFRVLWKT